MSPLSPPKKPLSLVLFAALLSAILLAGCAREPAPPSAAVEAKASTERMWQAEVNIPADTVGIPLYQIGSYRAVADTKVVCLIADAVSPESADGGPAGSLISCLDRESGQQLWRWVGTGEKLIAAETGVLPVAGRYLAVHATGSDGQRVIIFDSEDGKKLWERKAALLQILASPEGTLFTVEAVRTTLRVSAISIADNQVVWRASVPGGDEPVAALEAERVILSSWTRGEKTVRALNAKTGRQMWTRTVTKLRDDTKVLAPPAALGPAPPPASSGFYEVITKRTAQGRNLTTYVYDRGGGGFIRKFVEQVRDKVKDPTIAPLQVVALGKDERIAAVRYKPGDEATFLDLRSPAGPLAASYRLGDDKWVAIGPIEVAGPRLLVRIESDSGPPVRLYAVIDTVERKLAVQPDPLEGQCCLHLLDQEALLQVEQLSGDTHRLSLHALTLGQAGRAETAEEKPKAADTTPPEASNFVLIVRDQGRLTGPFEVKVFLDDKLISDKLAFEKSRAELGYTLPAGKHTLRIESPDGANKVRNGFTMGDKSRKWAVLVVSQTSEQNGSRSSSTSKFSVKIQDKPPAD